MSTINYEKLSTKFKILHNYYLKGELTTLQLLKSYIIYYYKELHGAKWLVKPNTNLSKNKSEREYVFIEGRQIELISLISEDMNKDRDLFNKKIKNSRCTNLEFTINDIIFYNMLYKAESYLHSILTQLIEDEELSQVQLFNYIPKVEEVFELQCQGKRCVTLFLEIKELEQVYPMEYPPFTKLDALGFTVHDLQHLSMFLNKEVYYQQVGLLNYIKPHLAYWKELLNSHPLHESDIAHLISDMNSYASHMLSFLKAKLINHFHYSLYPPPCSQVRLNKEETEEFEKIVWERLIVKMPEDVKISCKGICNRKLDKSDKTLINNFFDQVGKIILKKKNK